MKKNQAYAPFHRSTDGARPHEEESRVIEIKRVSRTVKGGRRIRFRAVVILGNLRGKIGLGIGKGREVSQAVSKATTAARKKMIEVPLVNYTIPFEVKGHFGSADILFKPKPEGTSIIAGGVVRTIAEVAGLKNLSAKILGTNSKLNNAKATILAFKKLRELVELKQALSTQNEKPTITKKTQTNGRSKK